MPIDKPSARSQKPPTGTAKDDSLIAAIREQVMSNKEIRKVDAAVQDFRDLLNPTQGIMNSLNDTSAALSPEGQSSLVAELYQNLEKMKLLLAIVKEGIEQKGVSLNQSLVDPLQELIKVSKVKDRMEKGIKIVEDFIDSRSARRKSA